MSEEEFLSRWSRRKRESRAEPAKPAEAQLAPPAATEKAESEFDLSSLPSIDDINAAIDITAFLSKNVPQELSRAALRRAWASDPAIRDFVGLAENAWDFNDPNAMPGFGPLDCSSEELAALVDRVVGGVREALQSAPDALIEAADSSSSPQLHQADAAATADVAEPPEAADPLAIPVAMQPTAVDRSIDHAEPIRARAHGGALPR